MDGKIAVQRFDPTYDATRLHFEDLANRYGNPIIILSLIKVCLQVSVVRLSAK
jgi:hypothetical protein